MKAKILKKQEIAKETLLVTFDLLGKEISFKPGQYILVELNNPPYSDFKGSTRHFSIVNSPNEKGVLMIATRIRESAFKKSLAKMPVGSEVEVLPIMGDFILPEKVKRPVVFIAGGIGITPFMSMLRFIKEKALGLDITLIYSNRDKQSTAFFKELKKLDKEPNIKVIFTMTEDSNWRGEKSRVDSNFIKKHLSDPEIYQYMVAGPPGMVEAMFTVLQEAGVERGNIKTENFTGY